MKVIHLNGSINSGKTTVSKALKARMGRVAHVEIDHLRAFIEWMDLDESIPLNLQNAVSVSHTFLRYGLDVILSYPLSKEDFSFIKESFTGHDFHSFTLCPKLEVALTNRGGRELAPWEESRIRHHYECGIAYPDYETISIDNSTQSPEETASRILEEIKKLEQVSGHNSGGCAPSA